MQREPDGRKTCLDNVRVTYNKLAVVMIEYLTPLSRLNLGAEVIQVKGINTAVQNAARQAAGWPKLH